MKLTTAVNTEGTPPGLAPEGPQSLHKVTLRALLIGFTSALGLAWLNCWVSTRHTMLMLGDIQMPFGAIFALMLVILLINLKYPRFERHFKKTTTFFAKYQAED